MPSEIDIIMAYLGKSWSPGGRGPNSFDCFGLCIDVYVRHFKAPISPRDGLALQNGTSTMWKLIATPEPFCVVLMRSTQGDYHMGLWLESNHGCIIHCAPRCGVTVSSRTVLRDMGLDVIGFYKLIQQ